MARGHPMPMQDHACRFLLSYRAGRRARRMRPRVECQHDELVRCPGESDRRVCFAAEPAPKNCTTARRRGALPCRGALFKPAQPSPAPD